MHNEKNNILKQDEIRTYLMKQSLQSRIEFLSSRAMIMLKQLYGFEAMELMLALKARMLQYEGILIYEPSLIEEMEERFGDRLDAGIDEVVTAACRLGIFDPLYFEYDILTGPQIRDIYASMRAASLLPEEEED